MGGKSLEVTAVGAVVILLSFVSVVAGRLAGAALLGATIPLSASAAMILGWAGGATILCVILAAASVITRAVIEEAGGALRGKTSRAGIAAAFLVMFLFVAVVGGYALPRLFEGATEVYAMDRTVVGVTSGVMRFPLTPLSPHAGNITQSTYLFLSVALCLATASLARRDRRYPSVVLWAATLSQSAFGLADLVGVGLMEHFRTATYAIAPNQSVAGFTRLIGGATEPSFFGAVSVGLCAWHLWLHRLMGGMRHLMAGGLLAALALGSLSSTAIAVLVGVATVYMIQRLVGSRSLGAYGGAFILAALGLTAAAWLMLGPFSPTLLTAGEALFLDKLSSESGIERSAWARQSLINFSETSGLGTGLGASRANGWATAILGQTGLPGALLATGFLIAVFARRLSPGAAALRAGALAMLSASMLSASRVDLGPLFFTFAGCVMADAQVRLTTQKMFARATHAPHPL